MLVASLFDNISYAENHPTAQVLIHTDYCKEIRILFKSGQEMKAHKAPYPIIIEIVDGEIDFMAGGENHLLSKGTLVSLEGHIVHSLKATKDSIVRLSLYKNDQIDRVQEVVQIKK